MPRKLRLGTRGSKLAMAQAASVQRLLRNLEVEIVPIKTSGDRGDREVRGAFVREIQHALINGAIDAALHCLKDLPTDPVPDLCFAAHLPRGDVRDALVGRVSGIAELPEGATIGTGSIRRTSQIMSIRPDLQFKPLVGNVDTRLSKLQSGEYDAIILAVTGFERLGLLEDWSSGPYADLRVAPLEPEEMLPAPGQAVLVLEARSDSPYLVDLGTFDHEATRLAATAERILLAKFGGGCSVPVAALATATSAEGGSGRANSVPEAAGPWLTLEALVGSPDGSTVLRSSTRASTPEDAATQVFEDLASRGGLDLFPRPVEAR